MPTSIEKKARSVEEAVAEAVAELGIAEEDAVVNVIQESSKGFLGLGGKEAIVEVSVRGEDAPEQEQEAGDGPVATAKKFITDVLNAMGIEVQVSAVYQDDILDIELSGPNMGIVIGKRGDTLDSIQYLTSLVVNKGSQDYIKVSIDTENYREKRRAALVALSDRLAAKVARTGKKFSLEPMNPYERRIIHSNLQANEDVTTFSVGQEPYRKVIIAPKNAPQGYGKGRGDRRRQERRHEPAEQKATSTATYKADFKPQQHKAEYKNFEEYLAAHSND